MIGFWKKLILLITIILFSGLAYSAFPGMTPSSLNIEGIEPGETVETSIYLSENLEDNQTIIMNADVSELSSRMLFDGSYSDEERISEESIEDWWEFEETALSNENDFSPDGSDEVFQGVVDVTLSVPNDAEPGIRHGKINFEPEVETEDGSDLGGQLGFAFNPTLPYVLEVEGNARRDIIAQDVRGFRLDEDEAAIEVLLRNTGTVTSSFQDFELEIIDSSRDIRRVITVNSGTLEPGESQWFDALWQSEEPIQEGSYEIDGEINYFTGQAYASGSFSLPSFDIIEVRPDDSPAVESEDDSLPIWLVLMVLVVLGVLMWSFEIDPVWIFGIVGVLGISAFVLMSGVSNLLLVGVLIPALLIVYLGV